MVFSRNRGLLDSYRRGDREALTTIYWQYVDQVAALVRRGFFANSKGAVVRGIREHDRQGDLVQEVFVRAFSVRARRAYDGASPYGPYLLRIAKNLMIDEARKAGRVTWSAVDPAALAEDIEVESISPEDDLEWRRLREATRAFCTTLSETLQRFVHLRFEEGHSQRDIAEALQVTRRKARTWERQVREGLRRYLEKRGGGPWTSRPDEAAAGREPAGCVVSLEARSGERTSS